MAYIGRDPQYGAFEKQAFTADSSTTTFTLNYTVGSSSSILVSVAGVHQEPEVAYNLAAGGTQIVFTAAPTTGDTVFVVFLGVALEVSTIGTGVITGQTELSEQAANDDLLLIYDTSATALRKIQVSNVSPDKTSGTATGDGSTTAFTINSGRDVNDVLVIVNGVVFVPTTDYTISGTTLTFQSTAPSAGAEIVFRYI
tara:strand:- start:165 stop:758 length:594 start_codon:yes stop_codon:yes gene_type:complete